MCESRKSRWTWSCAAALLLAAGCGEGASPVGEPEPKPPAPELPSEAPLQDLHAFGDFVQPKHHYASDEDCAADSRDAVLRVIVTDEDGETPIPGATVSCRGVDDGDPLKLRTGSDGSVTFTGVPAIWLALRAGVPADTYFDRSHEGSLRLHHGGGDLRIALRRRRWFHFAFEVPQGVEPPDDIEISYVREGFEGLTAVVGSRAGYASLDGDDPHRIALPEGRFTVRMSFTFRPDLPALLLTGVEASDDPDEVRTVRLYGGVPVLGHVRALEGGAAGGLQLELQRRVGREIVERVLFDGSDRVERLAETGSSVDSTVPPVTSVRRAAEASGWDFESTLVEPGARVDVIARVWNAGRVVAWARQVGITAGGPPADLRLAAAVTVRGTALGPGGTPADRPVNVRAVWPEARLSRLALVAEVESAPDGTFELAGLPPLPLRIVAGGPFEAVYTPVPFEGVPPDGDLQLEIAPTLQLRGVLRDAATGRPLTIDLTLDQEGLYSGGHGIGTHGDGEYWMSGVVPGRLRLTLNLDAGYPLELEPVEIATDTTDVSIRLPE
jgi:hypothetical protein